MRGSQKKERYLARIMGSTQVETLAGLPTLGETNNNNFSLHRCFQVAVSSWEIDMYLYLHELC